jgi:hypothetical protein
VAITTDKQRQALEAKGWTLGSDGQFGEFWTHDAFVGGTFLYNDGDISLPETVNRHRLAEFLSIINGRDETVTIEGVVEVSGGRDGWAFVGKTHIETALEPFNEKRVRVTIEPLDDAKEVAE